MIQKNRARLFGVAFVLIVLGACDGKLKISDQKRWTGNAADCPSTLPDVASPCNVAEGQICRYTYEQPPGENNSSLCGCWEAGAGDLRWDCYDMLGFNGTCPDAQPTSGTDCNGDRGARCDYPPMTECECALEGDAVWQCKDLAPHLPGPPTTVDATKPIDQLTAADREAWCKWYLSAYQGPGFPDPPLTPLTPDGMTTDVGCKLGSPRFECAAVPPQLPPQYCEGNLALSTCKAPLAELSDCVLTTIGDCWPSPHGCARYLEKPGCPGTMVNHQTDGMGGASSFCSFKVQ